MTAVWKRKTKEKNRGRYIVERSVAKKVKTPEVLEEAYDQYLKGGDKSEKRKSYNFLSEDLSESLYSDCTEDRIPCRKENCSIKGITIPFISLA